ncbi:O-antigen polymerase [Prevotella sp. oral taxon 299]|uniref:O-antigen polymerase n=1 Tax=Prevotella sp. oral taxon 299 TaxID=652716 RepID=UPI0001C3F6A8|nr:O-antigen polymerase [Prevotella sp. oral taxon 299]EFC71508.1 hypothetical protein HMPREF0669_00180 [Prevotella sp. oral taxon 299 str. F0039]
MEITIVILLAIILVAFKAFHLGDLFAPWFLTTGIWFLILFLFLFAGKTLYPIKDQFYNCLYLWVPIFCFSSLITYYVFPQKEGNRIKDTITINHSLFNGLLILLTIIAPLYLYNILKIVMSYNIADLLYNMRIYNIEGEKNFGILNYTIIIGQVLLVIGLWMYPKITKTELSIIILANLINAFAIMGKTPILFIITTLVFVFYEKGYIKARSILMSAIPLFTFFFIFTNARTEQSSTVDNSMTLLEFMGMYVLSPPVAFGYITENTNTQFGFSTFSAFYHFLNNWGFGPFDINPGIQEFVFVPVPTNVYTIFQPFFEDFGYKGVAFFAFIYGTITGFLYRMSNNGNSIAKCIYTYFVTNLILQFFQENIILSIIATLEFIGLIIICTQNSIYFKWARHDKQP